MGADYGVLFFDATATAVTIAKAFANDTTTHLVPLAIEGDSIIVRIPLAKLGGDDGNLALTSTVGTIDRATDIIPNTGVILARQPTGGMIAGDNRAGERAAQLPAAGKRGYEPRWRK